MEQIQPQQPEIHTFINALQHEAEQGNLSISDIRDICAEYALAYDKIIKEQLISQVHRRNAINVVMLDALGQ